MNNADNAGKSENFQELGRLDFGFFVHSLDREHYEKVVEMYYDNEIGPLLLQKAEREKKQVEKLGKSSIIQRMKELNSKLAKSNPSNLQAFLVSALTKKPITAKYFDESSGREIRIIGEFIFCPAYTDIILAEKGMLLRNEKQLNELVSWKKICEGAVKGKEKGMEFIGLGAYTSIFDNAVRQACRIDISETVGIYTTQGSSYTAMSAYLGIRNAGEKMGILLEDSVASVVGASGSIGALIAQLIAPNVKVLYLVGRENGGQLQDKLEQIKRISELYALSLNKKPAVSVRKYNALKESDVVICATSSGGNLLKPEHFKKGAILGNVSVPSDLSEEVYNRADLLVVDLGLNLVPENVDLGLTEKYHMDLPSNVLYACAVQTICASLEKKLTGDDSILTGLKEASVIRPKKAFYTKSLAEKYGFKVALLNQDGIIDDSDFEKVRRNAERFTMGT